MLSLGEDDFLLKFSSKRGCLKTVRVHGDELTPTSSQSTRKLNIRLDCQFFLSIQIFFVRYATFRAASIHG